MKYFLNLFFLIIISTPACIEPFEPEVATYDSTLVVDALFSDDDKPSRVTLSRSFPYSEDKATLVEGARVLIEEEGGPSSTLNESQPGIYQNDPAQFRGEAGKRYRLLIQTPDGNRFESAWELMKSAPAIEDVYFEVKSRIPDDPNLNPVKGLQFYLNTTDAENNTKYYRWEFEETWKYLLQFPEHIRADFGDGPGGGDDQIIDIPFDEFEGSECWKTVQSTQLFIATTENLTEDIIKDLPLHFIDNSTSRMYIRYSLLVKQYALSENYYEFLRKIVESNQATGSLFDPIPNEIFGNIRSADGKDIPVLGYFGVAGVRSQRIFVNREDLPRGFGAPFGPRCTNDTIDLDFQTLYTRIRPEQITLHDYNRNLFGNIIGYILTEIPCARCAVLEATNEKPDFW